MNDLKWCIYIDQLLVFGMPYEPISSRKRIHRSTCFRDKKWVNMNNAKGFSGFSEGKYYTCQIYGPYLITGLRA